VVNCNVIKDSVLDNVLEVMMTHREGKGAEELDHQGEELLERVGLREEVPKEGQCCHNYLLIYFELDLLLITI